MIDALVRGLALALYILAAGAFLVFLFRESEPARRGGSILLLAGFAAQTLSLILGTITAGQVPVMSLAQALGFSGWALAGVYLAVSLRYRLPVLGACVSPLAAVLLLCSALSPAKPAQAGPILQGLWLSAHLVTAFVGYGFLALSFLAGVFYLVQEREIKAKRTGGVYRRLPSLGTLDALNQTSLTLGFALITAGIVTGAIYAQVALGAFWRWDPKEVWAFITWLIYAGLIHQRLTVGWRGRRAAILSLVGFAVLCFTFLGVSHLSGGYHSFTALERFVVK